MTNLEPVRVTCEVAGKTLTLETGQVARQAHGAVLVTYGETQCFAASCTSGGRDDLDFFPLTVDYREKPDSAGKIPGGFFKREGRPTTKEILTMRLIDRSIRPLFPNGFKQEVQVLSRVFGYDGEHSADILAMIAGFASLHVSNIPFHGALGAMRVGKIDGELCLMPSDTQRRVESDLDLVVAGHKDAIVMVEGAANQLPESEIIDALEMAHDAIKTIIGAVEELREKAGKEKMPFTPPEPDRQMEEAVAAYRPRLEEAMRTEGKHERQEAVDAVRKECVEALLEDCEEGADLKAYTKAVKGAFHDLESAVERAMILSGTRIDGRAHDEVRPITIFPDFIPRQHGSSLFTRGETQALVSCTLGTPDDQAIIDGIEEEYKKRFYLHYNFPPYSVGETRRIMGPGRREIGHGMLAERALTAVLPDSEKFPYTIRIVSEITESNGSSSMASVCGGCLSMMSAGVPIAQPVAGIAMGLIEEGDTQVILTDILGSEDHNGDMDFKVAGSGIGVTAIQMDIKIKGVTRELLEEALERARLGRVHILRKMLEVVPRPASEVSRYAPAMELIKIPSDRIGFLIGPGGKTIKAMQAQYNVRIAILNDEGDVTVSGLDREKVEECLRTIQAMTETPKIGTRYKGVVKSTKDFGAFIEILPGTEGMCHISELAEGYVEKVEDVVKVGDEIEVVVINVDDRGKVKLSHRQALQEA
ncbi:MAG TPA: polyribonucleotide nucleotidyltransferase [Planctomycetes bacterium]|nr:polyribonucleotide nucleotidyltransferase [Planctomycetota bacterium]